MRLGRKRCGGTRLDVTNYGREFRSGNAKPFIAEVAENFRGDAEKKCSMSGGEFILYGFAVELSGSKLRDEFSSDDPCPAVSGEGRTTSSQKTGSDLRDERIDQRPARAASSVVDDQPTIAGLMSQLLTMRGYDVVTASNVTEAEAEVKKQAPDLILSDVRMPGRSGYDFVPRVEVRSGDAVDSVCADHGIERQRGQVALGH